MVGMADGYAQASGRPTHVNLHTAPRGRQRGRRDLQRPGQQVTAADHGRAAGAPPDHDRGQPHQPRSRLGPQPYVKWTHEPPRAQDVPAAIARAIHHASLPPRGPAFVSIPMDDWAEQADEDARARARAARQSAAPSRTRRRLEPGRAAAGGAQPGAGRRPGHRSGGGWDDAVALAEKQRLAVWATPATGGGRLGFPENHPNFHGPARPAIGPARRARSRSHDLVARRRLLGVPLLPLHPGPTARRGHALVQITCDPPRRRARRWARRSSATSGWRCERLVELLGRVRAPAAAAARPRAGPGAEASRSAARQAMAGARRRLAAGRHRRRRDPLQHGRAAQPPAPVEARAATTSPPAAGWASGSPPAVGVQLAAARRARSCACSARAPRSTASPRCGRRSPTGCRSPSWCCATRST